MLICHPVAGKRKSFDICMAFACGAPMDAEGHVFYGVDESNIKVWRMVLAKGLPFFYLDNSYFDCVRGEQFRVTKRAIQIRNANTLPSDGQRFAALGLRVMPWQHNPGGHWVLCAQSPSFMADIALEPHWMPETLTWMAGWGYTNPIKNRPWLRDKLKQQSTLADDLVGANRLITHSSAAAVTATVAGIPVLVSGMSALHCLTVDNREHVLRVLADNQFTLDEMREGFTWHQLHQ